MFGIRHLSRQDLEGNQSALRHACRMPTSLSVATARISFLSGLVGVDEGDHPKIGNIGPDAARCRNRFSNEDAGKRRAFVAETGAHPCSRPRMTHVLGERP